MATSATSSRTDLLEGPRHALLAELAVQETNVADLRATVAALTGQADTDSLLEREIAEHGEAHAIAVIADIRAALVRIDDGTYGICERCGGPIPAARLEVIPFTRRCVACPEGPMTLFG